MAGEETRKMRRGGREKVGTDRKRERERDTKRDRERAGQGEKVRKRVREIKRERETERARKGKERDGRGGQEATEEWLRLRSYVLGFGGRAWA